MPKSKKESDLLAGLKREAEQEAKREREARDATAISKLKVQNAELKALNRQLVTDIKGYEHMAGMLDRLAVDPLKPSAIVKKEKSSRVQEGCPVLLLSDLHLEERVDPAEVNGLNEFNLEIAAKRLDNLAIGTVWLVDVLRDHHKGQKILKPGYRMHNMLVPMLGDIITNYLRLEDVQSNFLTPFDAIVFASVQLERFFSTLLARLPWIERFDSYIMSGNHDRLSLTRRPQTQKRDSMSLMPILIHNLDLAFKDEKRIRFEMAASEHHYFSVFDFMTRGMHGDQFRYEGGVGGIFVPGRRYVHAANKQKKADITWFGHHHTPKEDDVWLSNGSLIGMSPYGIRRAFDPEPPAQVFLMIDKERGKRLATPIQCA